VPRGAALPYEREGVGAAFDVGEFWDGQAQIDVVGVRDDGFIDVGECKWGTVRSARAMARDLQDRAAAFPNPSNATIQKRAFMRALPAGARDPQVRWHSLADLYDD
jgi:hypothetical protein